MSDLENIEGMVADFSKDTELTPELRRARRDRIVAFQDAMVGAKGATGPKEINKQVAHHFASGVYGREMYIPQGQMIVSKIHRGKTMNFIMAGTISVISEEGFHTFEAPYVFVSSPFTKRIVMAHTDVIWATAQGSHKTDLQELEEELIAKDFTELNQLEEKV